jgi:uncharacterized protein (DUF58 family)
MNRIFGILVRLSLAALGVVALVSTAAAIDTSTSGALAIALGAAALLSALAIAVAFPVRAVERLARPRSEIDVSTLVAQSHPDAAGHSRPRAPGFAA